MDRPPPDDREVPDTEGEKSVRGPRALLLLLVPVVFLLLWSGGYAFAKVGLRHSDPLTFLVIRYASATLLLLPAAVIYWPPFPSNRRQWLQVSLVGFLIQGCYFGFSYLSFASGVSAGAVALIVSMQPILVSILAPGLIGERVGMQRWIGLALGFSGAMLVIYARSRIEATSVIGVGFAVAALVAMSSATLLEKRLGESVHPLAANLVQYTVGLAVVLPLALALEPMHVDWEPEFMLALAYLVIGNSIIAITLLLAMIRAGEASRVSALLFLVPPMAALIAYLLIGEAMPPLAWAGMLVAAGGVVIATVNIGWLQD